MLIKDKCENKIYRKKPKIKYNNKEIYLNTFTLRFSFFSNKKIKMPT